MSVFNHALMAGFKKPPKFRRTSNNSNVSPDVGAIIGSSHGKLVPCIQGCGQILDEDSISRHLDHECTMRIVKCDYCSDQVIFGQMSKHAKVCSARKRLACPYCKEENVIGEWERGTNAAHYKVCKVSIKNRLHVLFKTVQNMTSAFPASHGTFF